MKSCGYCGRQNDEPVTFCSGCGTELTSVASPPSSGGVGNWDSTSPFRLGGPVAAALGVVLLSTAFYFAVGSASFQVVSLFFGGSRTGGPVGGFRLAMVMSWPMTILWGVGVIVLAYMVFKARCGGRGRAAVATAATIAIVLIVRFVPGIWWLAFPAVALSIFTRSSIGCYIGALLQCAIAAWLLGWHRWPKRQDESHPA